MVKFQNRILVDKTATQLLLLMIDLYLDVDGYLCQNNKKVKSNAGEDVHIDEYAGHKKSKTGFIFFKNDLNSLLNINIS